MDESTKNKTFNKKKFWKYFIIAVVFCSVVGLVIGLSFAKPKNTMEYVGFEYTSTTIVLQIKVGDLKQNSNKEIKTSSFSITYNGQFYNASKINGVASKYTIKDNNSETILTVTFNIPKTSNDLSSLEKDLAVRYKGNKLKFNTKTKVIL